MKDMIYIEKSTFITFYILTILIAGALSFLSLHEFYIVAVLGDIEDYPFGSEGPTSYFYRTASIYATVNFIWGLVYILIITLATYFLYKDKRFLIIILFLVTIVVFLMMLYHGQIGV